MKKITILFLSHNSQIGGAENCLFNLLYGLDRSKFNPIVVFPNDGPLKDKIDGVGIKGVITPLEWWVEPECGMSYSGDNLSKRLHKLSEIVDIVKPDIIHTNTSVIWEGGLVAKQKNIPHVWHIHEILNGHPSLRPLIPIKLLYSLVAFLSDKVVTVSSAVSNDISTFIPPEDLVTIHNGLDPLTFPLSKGMPIRSELNILDNVFIAIIVGQISTCKGHNTLFEAISLIKGKIRPSKFLIVGQGHDAAMSALHRSVEKFDITEDVIFLGYRSDAINIIAQADVLILPSIKEAFPTVVLEAMALGKPVIVTDCGGPSEMVVDGETGYVVPVDDPIKLCEKIIDAYLNREKIRRMGKMGRERFVERFTLNSQVSHFEELYQQISERRINAPDKIDLRFLEGIAELYELYIDKIKLVQSNALN